MYNVPMKQVKITIYGQVQQVGFRFAAANKADELNIVGWVKNNPDGSIKIVAQAKEDSLERFINWCYFGPQIAEVKDVKVEAQKLGKPFSDFKISP